MSISDLYKRLTTDPKKLIEEEIAKLEKTIDFELHFTKREINSHKPDERTKERFPHLTESNMGDNLDKYLQENKPNYIRTKEQLRREPEKQLSYLKDWLLFLKNMQSVCFNFDSKNRSTATDKEIEEAYRKIDEAKIAIEEIDKRFNKSDLYPRS